MHDLALFFFLIIDSVFKIMYGMVLMWNFNINELATITLKNVS